ncbi:MAG: galactose-1-epimerase, partial [Pseudomonadales bacterium]|nr:galactose-1-epimerase [Pseudomonadales bacterium]
MSPTSVSREPFGSLEDGSPVHRFTLANDSLTASILDYGVRLQSLLCRLQGDEVRQCTLGFDKFETYLTDGAYIGAVVGRFANRIRDGRVTVDGSTCQLDRNEGDNHLHGGLKAFHNQKWQSATIYDGVVFS